VFNANDRVMKMPAYDNITDLTDGSGSAEAADGATAQTSENFVVTGPSPKLAAQWVQQILEIETSRNPLLDTSGKFAKFGDVGDKMFLVGILNEPGEEPVSEVTREITVDYGDALVFPLINSFNLYNPELSGEQSGLEQQKQYVYDQTLMEVDAFDSFYLKVDDETIVSVGPKDFHGKSYPKNIPKGAEEFAVEADFFPVNMPHNNLYRDVLDPDNAEA
jgi:hypothetical protein